MKRTYLAIASAVVAAGAVLTFTLFGGTSEAALPRDCINNSIINCGAIDHGELADRYKKNATGDLPAIYQNYGLNADEMTNSAKYAKMGEVTKAGEVKVDGKVVATDAWSIGRNNAAHARERVINGKKFYERTPATSFGSSSIVAYVYFKPDGSFKAAVLTSCGNPVSATPPPQPPKPPKPPVEQPKYECVELTKQKIGRAEYEFTAEATTSGGAEIKDYSYDFGDGTDTTVNETTVSHKYEKDGDYIVTVTANVTVNGETKPVTGKNCQVEVTVSPEKPEECKPGIPVGDERCEENCPVPGKEDLPKDSEDCKEDTPETPVVTELPKTGPGQLIMGGLGLSSLAGASYYWYASRKGLLEALLNR